MNMKLSTKKLLLIVLLIFVSVSLTGCGIPQNEDGSYKLIELTTTFQETMASENWFNAVLVWPMAQFLNHLTPKLGVLGAIALLTILVNVILLAFTLKAQVGQQQMQLLQPQLEKIQRKYEGRTDDASRMKQANEMNALYKKYDVNPFSMILITFLQFPIIIAMYQAVQRSAVLKSTSFLGLNIQSTPLEGIKNGQFLYIAIFAVMGICQFMSMYLPQFLAKRREEKEAEKQHRKPKVTEQSKQQKYMQYYFLVMILVFGLMWPTTMSIYWAINSLVMIAKTLLVQKVIEKKEGATA